jgi:hypothetical protein
MTKWGLDGDTLPIDVAALTDNLGHCLWTGVSEEAKTDHVVAHLMSHEMFTG